MLFRRCAWILPPILLALPGCAHAEPKAAPTEDTSSAKVEGPLTTAPGKGLPPAEARALYEKLGKEKNECPKGIPGLFGTWRFVGESKAENFKDEIAFQGGDFTEWLSEGPEASPSKGIVEGDYACIFRNRILFRVRKVSPDGSFDNHSGDSYACDLLAPSEPDGDARILLICFFDWKLELPEGKEFEYERVSD